MTRRRQATRRPVLKRTEVCRRRTGPLGGHRCACAYGLIEPGCTFLYQVPKVFGIVSVQLQREVPVRVGSKSSARKSAIGGIRLRHRLADQRSVGQDSPSAARPA